MINSLKRIDHIYDKLCKKLELSTSLAGFYDLLADISVRKEDYFNKSDLNFADTVLKLIYNKRREGKVSINNKSINSLLH